MIYVLYHHPCVDGFGGAYAAWKMLGGTAEYIGVSDRSTLPKLPHATEVYIIDFSYPRDVLIALNKKPGLKRLRVLDHHKSAELQLYGLGFAYFDMDRSGAGMAWDYFNSGVERPWFIDYIEDRDLRRNSLPYSDEIAVMMSFFPRSFAEWDQLNASEAREKMVQDGAAVLGYRNWLVEDISRHVQLADVDINPTIAHIPVVNAPAMLSSDVCELLLERFEDAPFVATYCDSGDGTRRWSLRSTDERMDVSEVATSLGGGGHRNAAGFSESFPGQQIRFPTRS